MAREPVQDLNAQRAVAPEQQQQLQAVGPAQSSGEFHAQERNMSPVITSLMRFGGHAVQQATEKRRQADMVAGMALGAGLDAQLEGGESPLTRQGFYAMQAKNAAAPWAAQMQEDIDNGLNELDPVEFSQKMAESFESLLTGNAEQDRFLTEAAAGYMQNLGTYHVQARNKKITADNIEATTQSVTDQIAFIKKAQKSGDIAGEAAARNRLIEDLKMPTLQNEEVRQQTYTDLAVLGYEMGDPTVGNFITSERIPLNPQQERAIFAAQGEFQRQRRNTLSAQYQRDFGDMEVKVLEAATLEEARGLMQEFQERYPNHGSNETYINLERKWRTGLAKDMGNRAMVESALAGTLAAFTGASGEDRQKALIEMEAEIDQNPELSDEDKAAWKLVNWGKNGLVYNHYKVRWNAGLTQPFNEDGSLNPQFEQAFNEVQQHYQQNPALALAHLDEKSRAKFASMQDLVNYGGAELRDAAVIMRTGEDNFRAMTAEQQQDFVDEVDDVIDEVMGRTAWSFIKSGLGFQEVPKNEQLVRNRVERLAKAYMRTGTATPAGAVEAAKSKIMEEHVIAAGSLIYVGKGQTLGQRLNVPEDRAVEAVEWAKNEIAGAFPDYTEDNTVLLSDPIGNSLMFGRLNDDGVLMDTVAVDMRDMGEDFDGTVLGPERARRNMAVLEAMEEAHTRQDLARRAVESGLYKPYQVEQAMSNIIGRNVLKWRVNRAEQSASLEPETGREARRAEIGAMSPIQERTMYRMEEANRNQNTPEQQRLLQQGELAEYDISRSSGLMQRHMQELETFEGAQGAMAIEGGGMTRGYGITHLSPEKERAIIGLDDKSAALVISEMDHEELLESQPGYDVAPESVQLAALSMKYNAGSLFQKQKQALASGDWVGFAKETLDVVSANDPDTGTSGALPGLARRRATAYNEVVREVGGTPIKVIQSTEQGITYLDDQGGVILSVNKPLHTRGAVGTYTMR